MNGCEKYQELISGLLDGELAPEEKTALEAHIEACPECRRMYDAFAQMSSSLSGELEEPPADLKTNVMSAIGKGSGKVTHISRWRSWLAVAACLAIIIFGASRANLIDKLGASAKGGIPTADTAEAGADSAEGADCYGAVTANTPENGKGRSTTAICLTAPDGDFDINDPALQSRVYEMLSPTKATGSESLSAAQAEKAALEDCTGGYTFTFPDGDVIDVSVQGGIVVCRNQATGEEFTPACTAQQLLDFIAELK